MMESNKRHFPWTGYASAAAIFIFAIFVIQNAAAVRVQLFLWNFELSLVLLILFSFFSGILIGWSLSCLRQKKWKPEDKA